MIQDPEPLESLSELPQPQPSSDKLKAVFLVSHQGTQITDLFGPAEILHESGAFQIITTAEKRVLSPTTGGIDFLPDVTLEQAPQPDVIFLPAIMDPHNPKLREWIKKQAPHAQLIVAVCEGVRLLASTGLLDGKKATSHFLALDDLSKKHPQTQWERNRRFIRDGKIMTSEGVTASLDAAFEVIRVLKGNALAQSLAEKMNYLTNSSTEPSPLSAPTSGEWLQLFIRSAFQWSFNDVGLLLYPGMSLTSAAAYADLFPRSLNTRVVSFSDAPQRELIPTASGIHVIPKIVGKNLPHLQFITIPSTFRPSQTKNPSLEPSFQELLKNSMPRLENHFDLPVGKSYARALEFVSEQDGPTLASYTAKMVQYSNRIPPSQRDSPFPWAALLRPILIGLLGMGLVRFIEKGLAHKRTVSTPAE